MEYSINGFLAGAQRWDMKKPKIKGGRVYVLGEHTGSTDAIAGLERITPSIPYDLFERLKGGVPGFYRLHLEAVQGAQGRDAERLLSVSDRALDAERLQALFRPVPGKAQPDAYYKTEPGQVVGLAVSASFYDMADEDDAERRVQGASAVFLQARSASSDNAAGFELLQVKMAFDLFEELKARGLPGEYRFDCSLTRRAGDKPALFLHGVQGENTLTKDRLGRLFGLDAAMPPKLPAAA